LHIVLLNSQSHAISWRLAKMKLALIRLARHLSCAATIFVLTACAAVAPTSQKLQADAAPIKSLAIVVWMGDFSGVSGVPADAKSWYANTLPNAISRRIPAIFAANGVSVKKVFTSNAKRSASDWPKVNEDFGDASHVLVLSSQAYVVKDGFPSFTFDAYLWEAKSQKPVLQVATNVVPIIKQPLLRTQVMAGQLLNSFNDNGLIKLKTDSAVDLSGQLITKAYIIYAEDK
jgi:hypothetical protein